MSYHLQYQFAYKAWVFPLSEQVKKNLNLFYKTDLDFLELFG